MSAPSDRGAAIKLAKLAWAFVVLAVLLVLAGGAWGLVAVGYRWVVRWLTP